jgi:hypothetical protein
MPFSFATFAYFCVRCGLKKGNSCEFTNAPSEAPSLIYQVSRS